jgi:uncharacterized protein YeaO (DUF488 family)
MIKVKRIYEPYAATDGYRILIDRLWPRGIKKENAHVDLWLKEIAPSTELRKWFHAGKGSWAEFKTKYLRELKGSEAVKELKGLISAHKTVTLLYGSKDEENNHAIVVKEVVG